jgi:hypothetical protein
MERIVVRGSRFETAAGSQFEPRGFHFVRRADAFNYVFSSPYYDTELISQTLFNIAVHNFVRHEGAKRAFSYHNSTI